MNVDHNMRTHAVQNIMSDKLEHLNSLPPSEAESLFRDCCGSNAWARKMAAARPFDDLDHLIFNAESIWHDLGKNDWLEAFAAHPRIGAKKAAPAQGERAATWSKGEQARVDEATDRVREELAEANELYFEKFGYIFIVCATGKSADEMLAICLARMSNSPKEELPFAAEEQRKITEIRLRKLVEV
jgi:OHCU decarboxylase